MRNARGLLLDYLPTMALVLVLIFGWPMLLSYVLFVLGTMKVVIDTKSEHAREVGGVHLLDRYCLFRTPWFRVFLHRLLNPDSSRYPHNHPWSWCKSFVLWGGYLERRRLDCSLTARTREYWASYGRGDSNTLTDQPFEKVYHSIEDVRSNTWTLFLAGSKRPDKWGFLTPEGFLPAGEDE